MSLRLDGRLRIARPAGLPPGPLWARWPERVALALILALVGGLAASVGALRIARSGPEPQVS